MGALNPLFLLAALVVGVPLFLHLFQRQEARRVAFPALRYLQRTEREHARRIRSRQHLLLFLRAGAVLSVVGAGAGLFLRGRGSDHPPTALAIVLDNSMSSGLVAGEERVLDGLKELALRTLADATDLDRIWVIRAGEPWLPSAPGGPDEARGAVRATRSSMGPGDLRSALERAAALVGASELPAREIHLLSDLQASALPPGPDAPAGNVPVVVWAPGGSPRSNRALTSLLVGGGLPPLDGQRYEVTVAASPPTEGDTAVTQVRILLDGRVRSAATLPPGASVSLPLPPAPRGWTVGWVEADPDALSADDRRYFAFQARPVPTVALAGDVGAFVEEAVRVLEEGGRLRRTTTGEADLLVSGSGEGLEAAAARGALLVLPPQDPTLLPALNRRIRAAGIPWQLERADSRGEVPLEGPGIPAALEGARAGRWYTLDLAFDPLTAPRTLARAAGEPWAVEGADASGRRYLLIASPMDEGSTSLPVSAAMVRLMDWVAVSWAARGGTSTGYVAGSPLSAPRDADAVRLPSGVEIPLDGTRMVRSSGEAGIYTFLRGDTIVAHEAVNPPAAESDLTPLDGARLSAALGPEAVMVDRESGWERAVFRARRGPDLSRFLLLGALGALLLEALVASTGRSGRPAPTRVSSEGTRGAS
ncbi:MAG: hypothetical protein FIA95_08665 [Gemmatimonadetes bacterium]|nr:hypothetical protein [Gemmatimonadota bacterium]